MTEIYIIHNKFILSKKHNGDKLIQQEKKVEWYLQRAVKINFRLYYFHLDEDANVRHVRWNQKGYRKNKTKTNNNMQLLNVPDKVMIQIMLFHSVHGYYLHFMDYPHFVEYPHFVDIIRISWMYLNLVDIIRIGHITRYLDHNVCHVLHTQLITFVLSLTFNHIV